MALKKWRRCQRPKKILLERFFARQKFVKTNSPKILERNGGAGAAGGAIDGFNEGDGFAAFGAVAHWLTICLDGAEEVFEDFLMASDIGDCGSRRAGIRVFRRF